MAAAPAGGEAAADPSGEVGNLIPEKKYGLDYGDGDKMGRFEHNYIL
jgi:hypothetical protein